MARARKPPPHRIGQGIRWRLKLTEPYLVNQSGHTDDGRGAALVTLTTAEGPLPDRSEWFREPETPSSTLGKSPFDVKRVFSNRLSKTRYVLV